MVFLKKKDLIYFWVFIVLYIAINLFLTRLFDIKFNSYYNGSVTLSTYHFLRLLEIVIITVLCFLKQSKNFVKPLIHFNVCLIISWIIDTFVELVFFEKSISLTLIFFCLLITIVCLLNLTVKRISCGLNKIKFYQKYKAYILMAAFIVIYLSIFALNLFIPIKYAILNKSQSYNGRMWMICNLMLIIIATYYIFKIKHFNWLDLVVALMLGISTLMLEHNPIGIIENILCYYAACGIFRKYSHDTKVFNFDFSTTLKSFGFGIIFGIPLAIINVLINGENGFLNMQIYNLPNIWNALRNCSGAISEEITYHFLPFAMVVYWFKNKIPKSYKTQITIYIFLILPHAMNHVAADFALNPMIAILDCIKESIIFGVPFIWLMKNKGIQSNSIAHTIIVLLYRMCGNSYVG